MVVLRHHLHGQDLDDCQSAAGKWVENIIHQMQADGFDSKSDMAEVEDIPKPKRGRPKKQDLKPDLDLEIERKVQTRSQGNKAVTAIHALFQSPCLTKSPTKVRKKVGVPHYSFGSY